VRIESCPIAIEQTRAEEGPLTAVTLTPRGKFDLTTKADLRELEHALRAALPEVKADTIKWVAGLLPAQAALVAPLVKLL
jgi:hypothetical protein